MILKVLLGISFLRLTKLLVEVFNFQNGQRKITYNTIQKHYKWGDRDIIEMWCTNSQWTSGSKANWLSTKPEKYHVGRPSKVLVAILFPQEIRKEDEEPTKDGK